MELLFILDASVFLSAPEVLAKANGSTHFAVPRVVLENVRHHPSPRVRRKFEELLHVAVANGLEITDISHSATANSNPRLNDALLDASPSERALALLAWSRISANLRTVNVVTNSSFLRSKIAELQIGVTYVLELPALLKNMKDNPELLGVARSYSWSQGRSEYGSVLFGTIAAVTIFYSLPHLAGQLGDTRTFVLLAITVLAGTLLFSARQRFRMAYGVTETVVGILSAATALQESQVPQRTTVVGAHYSTRVFHQAHHVLSQAHEMVHMALAFPNLTVVLKILAGLYIIVRGMDNLGKEVIKTRWGPVWNRYFKDRS